MLVWKLVPIIEPMDYRRCNVYEHTPADIAKYGEYPRYINPPGWNQPKTEWKLIVVDD